MVRLKRPKLAGLSQIYGFFRSHATPVTLLAPTPHPLMGLERWVNDFKTVTYFDCFEGAHPHIWSPREQGPREFRSIEAVNRYLLRHPEVRKRLTARGGVLLMLKPDDETEALAGELGLTLAFSPLKLCRQLEAKIPGAQIANAAGVKSVPHALGRAASFGDLMALAAKAKLGHDLVVQSSGGGTIFMAREADWTAHAGRLGQDELKVMRRIVHATASLEAVATRHGTLAGPLLTESAGDLDKVRKAAQRMARKLGDHLFKKGYKGAFTLDLLIETQTREVYLSAIRPRLTSATAMTHLLTSTYGGCPIHLFHLLEFSTANWELDLEPLQKRYADFDDWSKLVITFPANRIEMITQAPATGVYRIDERGRIALLHPALDWTAVSGENEAFFLRVHTIGDYRYRGAELGLVVARGRLWTAPGQLNDRAKAWTAALLGQFAGIAVSGSSAPAAPAPDDLHSMF